MKRSIIILLLVFTLSRVQAQQSFIGLSADYNSGLNFQGTYGLGVHVEVRVANTDNLYFNWHYGLGGTDNTEFYARGGMSLLLYGSRDWWSTPVNDIYGLLGLIIGPIICPNGMTYYFPQPRRSDFRIGIYANPLILEFWDKKPVSVTSWTLEGGVKILYTTNSTAVFFAGIGGSKTNNLCNDKLRC